MYKSMYLIKLNAAFQAFPTTAKKKKRISEASADVNALKDLVTVKLLL